VLEGYADGGVADAPFDQLVYEIGLWLADRRPDAVITFGPHGVTGHPDHVVVGSATRWAVEQLAERGVGPHAVYVVSPVFAPGGDRYDLSGEEQGATHRIDITAVAGRKLAALECHASQPDAAEQLADLRAALDQRGALFEGYTRVRPAVQAPHPEFDRRLV
jgi:LmbE family N-acetylglucosaminyl deacetylase